jgi:peptide/nickel transport system permease protein
MRTFSASRLALIPTTMLGVTLVVFIVMRALPGDVVDAITEGGPAVSAQQRAAIRAELGLDKSLPVQYVDWLSQLVRLDFGRSLARREPIANELARRAPLTLELAFFAICFSALIGISSGVLSAIFRDRPLDYVLRFISLLGLALPLFWIMSFTRNFILPRYFGWLPPAGYQDFWKDSGTNLQQILLPAFLLGLAISALTSRVTRSAMLDVLSQDYIRTARAKGLRSRSVVMQHALRNALIPPLTLMGVQFGTLLGGTVITETIFGLPGIGRYSVEGIQARDYPVVQAIVCISAFVYLLLNYSVDVMVTIMDPRTRGRA